MSRYLVLICPVLVAFVLSLPTIECFAQTAAPRTNPPETQWRRVSFFKFDWNNRGMATVVIEIPSKRNDPGDFTRIRIAVPGRKEFVLTNKNGWVKYGSDEASLSPELKKTNLIRSNYVLGLKAKESRTLLFLFGYSYASSPGRLDVLEVSNNGQIGVILQRDEFGLKELRDLDGDGLAEIVGYPCLSQEWGNGLWTYDPFNVYTLGISPAVPVKISLPLSKTYNLKHYYGWAGAKCSEDFAVVLHPPTGGKPVVVTKKEAESMTAK
jgi:hypothetical protein